MSDFPGWPQEFAHRYREAGYWRGVTFAQMLEDSARRHPDNTAVVDRNRRCSYAELRDAARAVADGFRAHGIGRGDRVVVQLPNIVEFFETVFALFHLGALPVFALPAHRRAEIQYFCEFTRAAGYVIAAEHERFDYVALAESLDPRPQVFVVGDPGPFTAFERLRTAPVSEPDPPYAGDVAFLQLSGGSTGVPKLIPRTHDDYLYSVRASVPRCGIDADSVMLIALPAAHNFPLSSPGSLGALCAGATVVLAENPAPETVFALIEAERVTITAAVPPLAQVWLQALPNSTRDLSSLRVLQVGGAKFSEVLARRIRPELGATLQQVFGMAEGLVNYTSLTDPEETIVTTQGKPISPDDEIRIVDADDRPVGAGESGHLLTRGPYTIRGYYRADAHNATAFTADGFYRTGDLVRRAPDGSLVVVGRSKEQINRGGEKIAPDEVESHLLAHPAVLDAAVIGIPDEHLGERSMAFVLPRAGAEWPRPLELRGHLRDRALAGYKLPDRIEVVERFPHTGVGKISKAELRRLIAIEFENTKGN
ncbi:(2,3-dihydroxybenzoyl)adenylate synthase [Sciscionella marina]|uniref:(2,3-dihydroxybenzoyl)adenylate synthase n=1 Tax=Sciscionella marina TaxID=508770 RepID=UPI00035E1570|nr:AMP-binding protein [Sciscionella marina]